MIVAVTGHKGRLGSWLVSQGCYPFKADIANREEIRAEVKRLNPDVVINCAAYTNVDACEVNGEAFKKANMVNMHAPSYLRRDFGGYLVHISTSFVLDGENGPHAEDAIQEPLGHYAWSKYGGELLATIREELPTLIVRVVDLYGTQEKVDFVRSVRDLIELGQEIDLPSTLYGTPTYIPHLSEALLQAVDREIEGILHLAGSLTLSRFEFGQMIANVFDCDPDLIHPTSEIKGVAPRPLCGGLKVDKAKELGLPIYSPRDGLNALRGWEQSNGVSAS